MITIEKNGRKLTIPYSAYVQDYKDIGWVVVKKAEPKVSEVKEEKLVIENKEIEKKETKENLVQPIKKNGGRK